MSDDLMFMLKSEEIYEMKMAFIKAVDEYKSRGESSGFQFEPRIQEFFYTESRTYVDFTFDYDKAFSIQTINELCDRLRSVEPEFQVYEPDGKTWRVKVKFRIPSKEIFLVPSSEGWLKLKITLRVKEIIKIES